MVELLRSENISRRLGTTSVLAEISFSIYSGEILGIIGPNGAGKTTLMECLSGLSPMDTGTLYWKNRLLTEIQIKQFIFYLPDAILPYGEQRVEKVLDFFRQLYGAGKNESTRLFERLELLPVFGKQVNHLSRGYRRRLLLAIGLLTPQPLLMLDEPFDGFDLRQALNVMGLLREMLGGRTLLLAIHQLTEAERICDRFILLNHGRIAAIGTLAQLLQQAGLSNGSLEEVFLAIV